MSDGICIIPAKESSRRLPLKNIREFAGKPMLAHAIETARQSGVFSQVLVSTDSTLVADIARSYGAGVQFREKGWNDLGTQELAACVLEKYQAHRQRLACVLYATTPLILPMDLKEAVERYDSTCDNFIMAVGAEPLRDAGAFYIALADDFMALRPLIGSGTRLYVLPESRVCDINTEDDWQRALELYAAIQHA